MPAKRALTVRLGSAAEAIAFLDAARSEIPAEGRDYLLFRGESVAYPRMLPSVFRVPADRFHATLGLSYSLASHFWNDFLEHSLEFRAEGLFHRGEYLGNMAEISEVRSEPSYTDAEEQFQGLFQHYGWPTQWIDVTYEPAVAVFFAALDFKSRTLVESDVGHIYFWRKSTLRQHPHLWFKPIVDLRYMADALTDILGVPAIRPSRQAAACISVGEHTEHHEVALRETTTHITFARHDVRNVVPGFDHFFPSDPVLDILRSWERQFIRYLEYKRVETDEFGARLLEVARESAARHAAEYAERFAATGIGVDSILRFHDCARNLFYHQEALRARR